MKKETDVEGTMIALLNNGGWLMSALEKETGEASGKIEDAVL